MPLHAVGGTEIIFDWLARTPDTERQSHLPNWVAAAARDPEHFTTHQIDRIIDGKKRGHMSVSVLHEAGVVITFYRGGPPVPSIIILSIEDL